MGTYITPMKLFIGDRSGEEEPGPELDEAGGDAELYAVDRATAVAQTVPLAEELRVAREEAAGLKCERDEAFAAALASALAHDPQDATSAAWNAKRDAAEQTTSLEEQVIEGMVRNQAEVVWASADCCPEDTVKAVQTPREGRTDRWADDVDVERLLVSDIELVQGAIEESIDGRATARKDEDPGVRQETEENLEVPAVACAEQIVHAPQGT